VKNKWLRHTQLLAIGTLVRLPIFLAFCSMELRASAQRMNKYGDRGAPWRIPRVGVILPCDSPLINMEYEMKRMHFMIN
jgi:hypothetical protein